jgi:hypothetical protein
MCSKQWIGDKQKQSKIHENKQKLRNSEQDLIMNGHVFEAVQNFRHLGALIN